MFILLLAVATILYPVVAIAMLIRAKIQGRLTITRR